LCDRLRLPLLVPLDVLRPRLILSEEDLAVQLLQMLPDHRVAGLRLGPKQQFQFALAAPELGHSRINIRIAGINHCGSPSTRT
jgi:hypothetical protein